MFFHTMYLTLHIIWCALVPCVYICGKPNMKYLFFFFPLFPFHRQKYMGGIFLNVGMNIHVDPNSPSMYHFDVAVIFYIFIKCLTRTVLKLTPSKISPYKSSGFDNELLLYQKYVNLHIRECTGNIICEQPSKICVVSFNTEILQCFTDDCYTRV